MITAIPVQRGKPRLGLVAGLVAAARGLAFAGLMLAELGLLAVLLAAVGLTALGCGILVVGNGASGTQQALLGLLLTGAGLGLGWFAAPGTLTPVRSLARPTRRLAGQRGGVPIADPYRPPPVHEDEPLTLARRLGWLLTDRATWRDLRWILVNLAGWLLTALPAAIVLTGLIEFIGPELLRTIPPPAFPGHAAGTLILLGLGIIAVGVVAAPWLLRGYALLASSMLAPTFTDEGVRGALADRAAAPRPLRGSALLASSMLAPTFTDEGIRAALAARREVPGLPVLVLSQYVEQLYARELLASGTGGIGYLLKDRVFDSAQFVDAVRRVAAGGTAMDPEVISRLLARNPGVGAVAALSPREREVLALMTEGRSNAAVAARLVITERAVAKHTASIFLKLGLQPSEDDNRRVLAVLAYLDG